MEQTTHISPADIFVSGDMTPVSAPEPDLDELEYRAMRHEENLAGLDATQAYHTGQIERFEAALVTLRDVLAHLPADATAHEVHAAKSAVLDAELECGAALEEIARLQPQLAEERSRAAVNEKALVAARAKPGQ